MIGQITGLGRAQRAPRPASGHSWFGKLARKVVGLVAKAVENNVPLGLGVLIKQAVYAIGDVGVWATERPTVDVLGHTDYEPTDTEAALIEDFMANRFNPLFVNIVKDLDQAMASPDLMTQMAGINLAQSKMCVILKYALTNETQGLSPDAVKFRYDGIDNMAIAVDNVLFKILDDHPDYFIQVPSKITANTADFAPLPVAAGTYDCYSYVVLGKDANGQEAVITATSTTPNGTTVQTATGTLQGDPGKSKRHPLARLAILAGLGYVGYQILKPSKKPKKAK